MISIIDDDASVRAATRRLVRSLGYIAHTFASADELVRSSQLNDTSCVIADVQMPGMSGIELQTYLQTQGHRLPIIFITAFPEENVRAQALEAGAACFLSKPFDARTLIKYLNAALKSHSGRIRQVTFRPSALATSSATRLKASAARPPRSATSHAACSATHS